VVTIHSGTEKIVIIGRHNVSSFIPGCLIKAQVLLQAAVDIMEKQGASVADRLA
jgi:NADH:ubiquinone oxidoreductase subunit B-like Fe-S oxidoreductase